MLKAPMTTVAESLRRALAKTRLGHEILQPPESHFCQGKGCKVLRAPQRPSYRCLFPPFLTSCSLSQLRQAHCGLSCKAVQLNSHADSVMADMTRMLGLLMAGAHDNATTEVRNAAHERVSSRRSSSSGSSSSSSSSSNNNRSSSSSGGGGGGDGSNNRHDQVQSRDRKREREKRERERSMRAQIRAALPIRPTGPGGNAHITYIMDMLVRATHVERDEKERNVCFMHV